MIRDLNIDFSAAFFIECGDEVLLSNDENLRLFSLKLEDDKARMIVSEAVEEFFKFKTDKIEFIRIYDEYTRDKLTGLFLIHKVKIDSKNDIQISDKQTWINKKDIKDENLVEMIKDLPPQFNDSNLYRIYLSFFDTNVRDMKHSLRVSQLATNVAKEMKFSKEDIKKAALAGLLHDIGKMGIDKAIINKPARLSEEEYKEIKKHTQIGYMILKAFDEIDNVSKYTLQHHENVDGTGYPFGLKGDKIETISKIVHILDSYDAMTTERSYKKTKTIPEAIIELKRCSGTQFDEEIAKLFVEKILKEKWPRER